MSALDFAAGANPIFGKRNYFNRFSNENSGISVSSGGDFKKRAYSMVRAEQWTSENTATDGDSEYYQAVLYEGSTRASRSVSLLALLNINLKNFVFQYRDGGGSFSTLAAWNFTTTPNTKTDLLLSLGTAITFDEFKITATTVLNPSTQLQKAIGDIVISENQFQPSVGLSMMDPDYDELETVIQLKNGEKDYTSNYRSDDGNDLWSFHGELLGATDADRQSMLAIKRAPEPFIFIPEPGDNLEDVHLCKFIRNSFKPRRLTMRGASSLYRIGFGVESIGKE